jgi:hypothetical protein
MKSVTVALALAASLLAAGPAAAARKKAHPAPRAPEHIACTRAGCHPTPPGCHPEIEYDPWGNPTGFDMIVFRGRR